MVYHRTLNIVPVLYSCCCLVAKSHLTLCDLMDCSPLGSSVHGFPWQEYGVGCHFLLYQNLFLKLSLILDFYYS